jgi:hypothetical protein
MHGARGLGGDGIKRQCARTLYTERVVCIDLMSRLIRLWSICTPMRILLCWYVDVFAA